MKTPSTSPASRAKSPLTRLFLLSLTQFFISSAWGLPSVYTTPVAGDIADTFVTSGTANNAAPNKNYGGAGSLVVAGANSGNGEFDSLLKFTLAPAKTQFDTQFGAGNWTITNVSLSLAGNFSVQGEKPNNAIFPTINTGSFALTWMSNDTWVEGSAGGGNGAVSNGSTQGVTFNSLLNYRSASDEALGTYTFNPPGDNVALNYTIDNTTLDSASGFLSDIANGNSVSLLFTPNDTTISYLFNARSYASNNPSLTVTAEQVPEPSTYLMALGGLGMLGILRLRKSV